MKTRYATSILFFLFLIVPFQLASQIVMSPEYFDLHEQFRIIRIGNIVWVEPAQPLTKSDCTSSGIERIVREARKFIDLKFTDLEQRQIYILIKCEEKDKSVYANYSKIYRVKDKIFNNLKKKLQTIWELTLTEPGPVFGEDNPNWDKVNASYQELKKIQIIPTKPKTITKNILLDDLGLMWITVASEGGGLLFPPSQLGLLETSIFLGGNLFQNLLQSSYARNDKVQLAIALTLSGGYRNTEYTIPQGSEYSLLSGEFQTSLSTINFYSNDLIIQSAIGLVTNFLRADYVVVTIPIQLGFRGNDPGIDYAKTISEGVVENDFSKIEFASRFALQISPAYIAITIPWKIFIDDSSTIRLAAGFSFRIPVPSRGE
jgi:hypothetical protein